MSAWCRVGWIVLIVSLAVPAQARELILVFEESLLPSSVLDSVARSQLLVSQLKQVEVSEAAIVVNTGRMNDKNRRRLSIYDKASHMLINAGHNTALYSKPDLYRYEVSVLKADRWLSPYNHYDKHVRFTYLQEAGQKGLQKGLSGFLNERGYKPFFAPELPAKAVGDYLNQLYQMAHRDNRSVDVIKLGSLYINEVISDLAKQDAMLYGLLGYSPPQVLTLSVHDLTVYTLVDLVDKLVAEGWVIVPVSSVLYDPIANPLATTGWHSNTYLHRLLGGLVPPNNFNTRVIGNDKARIHAILAQEYPALIERLSRDSLESPLFTH